MSTACSELLVSDTSRPDLSIVAGNLTSLASLADSTPSVLLVPLKISEDDKHVLQVAIYTNKLALVAAQNLKNFYQVDYRKIQPVLNQGSAEKEDTTLQLGL